MTAPKKAPPKKDEVRPEKDEDQEVLEGAPKTESPEDPAPPPTPDERVAPPADEDAPSLQPPPPFQPLDTGTASPMTPRADVFHEPKP